jgi:hypothetical protein
MADARPDRSERGPVIAAGEVGRVTLGGVLGIAPRSALITLSRLCPLQILGRAITTVAGRFNAVALRGIRGEPAIGAPRTASVRRHVKTNGDVTTPIGLRAGDPTRSSNIATSHGEH